jgi:hypothetical protein
MSEYRASRFMVRMTMENFKKAFDGIMPDKYLEPVKKPVLSQGFLFGEGHRDC